MDKIILEAIEVAAIIGTLPVERVRRQRIRLDIALELDLQKASCSDALEDTVDYSMLEREAAAIADTSHFQLIEALAGAVGRRMLELAPPLVRCTVRVTKPGAARYGRAIAVELVFSRTEP